jgi:hypothetical protein
MSQYRPWLFLLGDNLQHCFVPRNCNLQGILPAVALD